MRQTVDEMNFFRLMARSWNRAPRPWSLFPEFLELVYDAVERERSEDVCCGT